MALIADSTDGAEFSSRGGAFPAQLVVTYAASPSTATQTASAAPLPASTTTFSPSPAVSPSLTAIANPTAKPISTYTLTPAPTGTATSLPTSTWTLAATKTPLPTLTHTLTSIPSPTSTPTVTRTNTPISTLSLTPLRNAGSSWSSTNWFTTGDAIHVFELDWRAATGAGATNGSLTFWIDGVQRANLTGVDNDTRRIDRVGLGPLSRLDSATLGTYYFDAFESRRQTYIGPLP